MQAWATLAALVLAAAAPVSARAQGPGWSVTSSIADGATLTAPVRWSAEPVGTPPGGLDRIEFLVDGKVLWTERHAPFDFNNDANFLYPYVFGRGPHQLVARGVSVTDEQVSATVNVQMTQAPPVIPRRLQATWKHRVTQTAIDQSAAAGDPRVRGGVWQMKLGPDGLLFVTPPRPTVGGNYAFSATARGTLLFGGPVNWLTAQSGYEGICHGDLTFARYRWKIAYRVLSLRVVEDPCRLRAAIVTGRWTR
jgi:hypothetical protein